MPEELKQIKVTIRLSPQKLSAIREATHSLGFSNDSSAVNYLLTTGLQHAQLSRAGALAKERDSLVWALLKATAKTRMLEELEDFQEPEEGPE